VLELLEQLGIWGGIAGLCIAAFLGAKEVYMFRIKPNLSMKDITDTEETRETKYGYFNLRINNCGKARAVDCELKLRILELPDKNKTYTLFWRDPTHKKTTRINDSVIIKAGGEKLTNIFELKANEDSTIIETQEEHELPILKGKQYTFEFELYGEPSAKKTIKFKVDIKDWNAIAVDEICS